MAVINCKTILWLQSKTHLHLAEDHHHHHHRHHYFYYFVAVVVVVIIIIISIVILQKNAKQDADDVTSKKIKWENFMVGLTHSGKALTRSPDLKALIRLGVPKELREKIWKG